MSSAATNRAWALDIPRMETMVLVAMAEHADCQGGSIFPSIGLIAWKTGFSENHTRRLIGSLVDRGILQIVEHGGGRGRTTRYCFDLTAGPLKAPYEPEYLRPKGTTTMGGYNGKPTTAMEGFTDNRDNMVGLSAEKVPQLREGLPEKVPSAELNPTISALNPTISEIKGPIAMGGEGTLRLIKDHHQETRARKDVELRGGGGGDERIENDEENLPEDSHMVESETANVKADLVDALVNLGIRPGSARQVVMDRIVASDRDVVLCKRFIEASTANNPPAVLWSQYLSAGRLPAAPVAEVTSSTPDWMKQRAQEYLAETDARNAEGDEIMHRAYEPSELIRSALKTIDRPSRVVKPADTYWRTT